jgi:ATP-dependent RNA helicase RhlE
VVEGFGPEPGEQAEPIAMGRQVLWGGKGRPPAREVMNAAAKAARSGNGQPRTGNGNGNGNGQQRNANGNGQQQARNGNGNGSGRPARNRPPQPAQGARPPQQQQRRDEDFDRNREDDDEERMPRNVDPLRTNLPGRRDMTGVKRVNAGGQPDPTRTSIDSMGAGKPRNRGRGGNPVRNYGR